MTKASDTLKPQNKSQMLGAALAKLAGLDIQDLSHFLNDTLAQVGNEANAIPDGASAANQATRNMHPSAAVKESVRDDLALVFGEGEELSEEFKEKTLTIFEAALETRLTIEREELLEEVNKNLEEAYDSMLEEIGTKVADYLQLVVEKWVDDNSVAIESSLRSEITENFIFGLKNLFEQNNFNMPEETVEVVEELANKNLELEKLLDTTLNESRELKAKLAAKEREEAIDSVCEGLVLTQAEKLRALCESVEFDGDLAAYNSKLNTLKESVTNTPQKKTTTGLVVEESDPEAAANGNAPTVVVDPTIERYMSAISRSARK